MRFEKSHLSEWFLVSGCFDGFESLHLCYDDYFPDFLSFWFEKRFEDICVVAILFIFVNCRKICRRSIKIYMKL